MNSHPGSARNFSDLSNIPSAPKRGEAPTTPPAREPIDPHATDILEMEVADSSPTFNSYPDFEEPAPHASIQETPALQEAPRRYIQGVIHAQQAFLITNVLRGESQTLFQPQMVWTLGRNRQAAFPLQDKEMSRRHAVIQYIPQKGFYLIDLNSMNGSFVNGTRVQQRHLLQDGDRVHLGNTTFTFFVSRRSYTLEGIHPEVLARLNASASRNSYLENDASA